MPRSTVSIRSARSAAAGTIAVDRADLDGALRRCGSRRTRPPARRASPSAPRSSAPRARRAAGARSAPLGAAAMPLVELGDPRVVARAHVDLAREHDRGGGRAADHRRVRALERDRLELVVEPAREDDEGAAVEARDHAERDRAVEVDDRAADLGAVLELQPAHRLRRAVEAGQVGEHDQRPPAGRRVDRAGDLLRRAAGTACPTSTARARRPARSPKRGSGRDSMPSSATGRPPRRASQATAISASRIPAQRSSGSSSRSTTARITERMSNGFLRPGLVVLARRSRRPCCRSESGASCGAPRDVAVGRVGGLAAAREALARRDVGVLVVAQEQRRRRRRGRAPSTAPGRWGPSRGRSRRCRSCPPPTRRPSSRAPACRSAPSRCRASSRGCRACA